MYSTHIRYEARGVADHSYDLTREQALANAQWAIENAYSVVVVHGSQEHIWSLRTATWTTRRTPLGC